jgi:hypothetical protein
MILEGGMQMKRVIIVMLAMALAPAALAQLYKYVDKDGKTVYSDQPPPNIESKQLNIPSGKAGAPAPAAAAPGKSYVERDKDLQKAREDVREKQKKSNEAEKKEQESDQRCAQARSAYQGYVDGGRIHKYNDKGERVYLGDAEMEVERERTKREMDEACKKA